MPILAALATAAAVASTAASAPAAPVDTTRTAGEPAVERHVSEDDQVRVEELRVRGETRRIVVKPKGSGAKEYEILPSSGANDPSGSRKGNAGERVWRIFSF